MTKERNFLIHPSYLVMFLLLAGVSALFLGFSGAYLYTRFDQGVPAVKLPSLFYFNTLLLIASSFCLRRARKAYKDDQTSTFKTSVLATLILTLLFLVSQILAWQQLMNTDIFVNYNNMASYMYLISGVHLAHVVLGIPFLVYFVVSAYKYMKSPVSVLIYFADERRKRHLNLFNIYWHFLDGLWIYLVLLFLINYLV